MELGCQGVRKWEKGWEPLVQLILATKMETTFFRNIRMYLSKYDMQSQPWRPQYDIFYIVASSFFTKNLEWTFKLWNTVKLLLAMWHGSFCRHPPQQRYVQAQPIISCHQFISREALVINHSYHHGHIAFSCVISVILSHFAVYTSSIYEGAPVGRPCTYTRAQ
jgi:hypothetical protein